MNTSNSSSNTFNFTGNKRPRYTDTTDTTIKIKTTTEVYIKNTFSKKVFYKSKLKLETYDDYLKLDIKDNFKEKEWIYNIIDHKAEQESIIFEDDNIIIIPDYKWDKNIRGLHILGIYKDKSLRSIRDLDNSHCKMLQESIKTGCEIISKYYNFKIDNILTFFHYHPSTWQLHVHFMNMYDKKTRSNILPRSHLASTVIQNIELIPDYYKKIKLEVYN
jgi:m7GpppX diphosphatase